MRILAFESSAKAASAALLADGRLLAETYQNSGLTHSRTLMAMAENLLRGCALAPADVDALAVAAGPGSFTGVRIGVAAAKGFSWGTRAPCRGVSTLEAMAWNAPPSDELVVPVMDARRGQVYCAAFYRRAYAVERVFPDAALSLAELGERLQPLQGGKVLVGDGAELCYNSLKDALPGLRLAPEHLRFQRAAGVALAAQDALSRGADADAASLVPNYLRMSQAERQRRLREETTENG